MKEHNRLSGSTSPYLLQHVNNPVNWYPWGEEALRKAKEEDKPIIVSIGYSSCHWCHVMAHESFEDNEVARIMNDYFIAIKIDREERPDIDQIYMEAVQAMGLRGGWPLNVFLTPDQKPFYGGTYFPREGWTKLLINIKDAFRESRIKLEESAEKFTEAINSNASAQYYMSPDKNISQENLDISYKKLSVNFDYKWGGISKAPKFPIPALWQFLVNQYYSNNDESVKTHLLFTFDKIAAGGIYDHVGGGFSRYSVDSEWHVPHFEKMLYDNGQLLSLYANGYKLSGKSRYKEIIDETVSWLEREMLDESGGYYSALDADSEGEEGKYYVWSEQEINTIAGANTNLIKSYYDVRPHGNWENVNVLRTLITDTEIIEKFNINEDQLKRIVTKFKKDALSERSHRIRPGLDNKIISSWNGLILTGLLDAYQATGDQKILELAKNNYNFITTHLIVNKKLLHVYDQNIQGFADDYALIIQALIKYYETVFDERSLDLSESLLTTMNEEFYDANEKMYFYTGNEAEKLIARQKEVMDNVIPSSNAVMAENLLKMGLYLDNQSYQERSFEMVNNVSSMIEQNLEFMAQWASTATIMLKPIPEIVIVGSNAIEMAEEINRLNIPRKIIMATKSKSELPLLLDKTEMNDKTTIYVCFNKTCRLPVHTIEEALKQIPR